MNKLVKLTLILFLTFIQIGVTKNTNAQDSLEFFTDQIIIDGAGCSKDSIENIAFGNEFSSIFNSFQAIAQPKK